MLVVVLLAIAALMVVLLLVGIVRGSIKPKPGWMSVGVVIVALTIILGFYRSSGGAFPRIVWGRTMRRMPPLHKMSVVPKSFAGDWTPAR